MSNEPRSDRFYIKAVNRRLEYLALRIANYGEIGDRIVTGAEAHDRAERRALLWLIDKANMNNILEELYNEDKTK